MNTPRTDAAYLESDNDDHVRVTSMLKEMEKMERELVDLKNERATSHEGQDLCND